MNGVEELLNDQELKSIAAYCEAQVMFKHKLLHLHQLSAGDNGLALVNKSLLKPFLGG